jgi:hypothetical protein
LGEGTRGTDHPCAPQMGWGLVHPELLLTQTSALAAQTTRSLTFRPTLSASPRRRVSLGSTTPRSTTPGSQREQGPQFVKTNTSNAEQTTWTACGRTHKRRLGTPIHGLHITHRPIMTPQARWYGPHTASVVGGASFYHVTDDRSLTTIFGTFRTYYYCFFTKSIKMF